MIPKPRRDHAEARRQGYYASTKPIFGYKIAGEIPRTILIPDPMAAPVVRGVYMMVAAGTSIEVLSKRLHAHSVFAEVTRRVAAQRLLKILKSPFYEGYLPVGKEHVVGLHEPLVSERLAREARFVLRDAKRRALRAVAHANQEERKWAKAEGFWSHQRLPYGLQGKGRFPRWVLVPGPEFAHLSALVHALALARGPLEIGQAEMRFRAEAPTPSAVTGWRITKHGRTKWPSQQIAAMLENPAYEGLTASGTPAKWPSFFEPGILTTARSAFRQELGRRRIET